MPTASRFGTSTHPIVRRQAFSTKSSSTPQPARLVRRGCPDDLETHRSHHPRSRALPEVPGRGRPRRPLRPSPLANVNTNQAGPTHVFSGTLHSLTTVHSRSKGTGAIQTTQSTPRASPPRDRVAVQLKWYLRAAAALGAVRALGYALHSAGTSTQAALSPLCSPRLVALPSQPPTGEITCEKAV